MKTDNLRKRCRLRIAYPGLCVNAEHPYDMKIWKSDRLRSEQQANDGLSAETTSLREICPGACMGDCSGMYPETRSGRRLRGRFGMRVGLAVSLLSVVAGIPRVEAASQQGGATETALAEEKAVPLSRDEFRRRVVEYSNQLKITRENVEAADLKVKKVRTGFYPSLGAQASFNYQFNQPGGTTSGTTLKDYSYTAQVSIMQNVYTGNAVTNQTRAAEIERSIAGLQQEMTLEGVIYSADLSYWAMAAAQKQLDIARTYVRIVDSLYRIVNTRFEDGYVSRTDLLMVETRLNEARLQEIAALKLYQSSLQSLNTLMGNRQPQAYLAADTIAQPVEMPGVLPLERILELRPDYRIAEQQLELSNQNVRVARSSYNPQLTVGVQGVYGTLQPNVTGEGKVYGLALAQLNVPIFRWNERRHEVNMARAAVRGSEWALVDAENTVNGDLAVARTNMERTREAVEMAEVNLNVALDNLMLNTFSYSEGRLPILDVLSAQLAWIQSYTAFVNSNYEYKVSIADYCKAQGTLTLQLGD